MADEKPNVRMTIRRLRRRDAPADEDLGRRVVAQDADGIKVFGTIVAHIDTPMYAIRDVAGELFWWPVKSCEVEIDEGI